MRQRVLDLLRVGDSLFSTRWPLMTLWQTLAENFHVMRADFTRARYPNEEFASYLMSSRPALAHRELKNALSATLRPRDQQWLHARTMSENINNDLSNKRYLDWVSAQQRTFMYERRGQFTRAAKENDGDWSCFGNSVMEVLPRRDRTGIFFRCWHLRDCAWTEDSELELGEFHRNWKPKVFELQKLWGAANVLAAPVANAKNEDAHKEVSCRHIVLPAEDYDLKRKANCPYVSVYLDVENQTILEERPRRRRGYIPQRWEFQTNSLISGSPYGYSPATVYGLPDARMFQQMTLTLLEAGQKSVDPPMIAVGEAINGGTNLFAGGMTWTDADYDERTGEVLRPIDLEFRGLQFGAAREQLLIKNLEDIFFNSSLQFPTLTKEMTAAESQRLYEEFLRKAIPLIEPAAEEMNGQICEMAFDTLLDMGAFGSVYDMPQALRGQEIRFQFDTPLQAASEKAKAQAFAQVTQMTVEGGQIDPDIALNLDTGKAYRDAVAAVGPADWILPKDQVAKLKAQKQAQAQAAQQAAAVAHGTDIAARMATAAKSGGQAAQALQQAGVM